MDNRKKEFLENRRSRKKPQKKTEFERKQTRMEVEQIKNDLINYAKTSWGKEWIDSNLQIGRPFRMQRGIDYANDEERIANVSISKGQIFATVQGTAPTPYRVKIHFSTIDEEDWKKIIKELSKRPLNLIELLEGKLPKELIKIFEKLGQMLFPSPLKGLDASCSCPDKAIPCKHIASVILYLSKVIDFNPFILLELRGKSKYKILDSLSLKESTETKILNQISNDSEKVILKFNVPIISNLSFEKVKKERHLLNFKINKPGKVIETIDNIASPNHLENIAFKIVLKDIYFTVSSNSYNLSLK